MSEYHLICVCGRQTAVTAAQCGETIRCACGESLDVPNLRTLKAIALEAAPAATQPATARQRDAGIWEDRHRGAFLLGLVGVALLFVALYLGWQLQALRRVDPFLQPTMADKDLTQVAPTEVMRVYREAQNGLQPAGPKIVAPDNPLYRRLGWEIGISSALGAGFLIAAAAVGYRRRKTIARKK